MLEITSLKELKPFINVSYLNNGVVSLEVNLTEDVLFDFNITSTTFLNDYITPFIQKSVIKSTRYRVGIKSNADLVLANVDSGVNYIDCLGELIGLKIKAGVIAAKRIAAESIECKELYTDHLTVNDLNTKRAKINELTTVGARIVVSDLIFPCGEWRKREPEKLEITKPDATEELAFVDDIRDTFDIES